MISISGARKSLLRMARIVRRIRAWRNLKRLYDRPGRSRVRRASDQI
jgi:hypothetical protein